MSMVKGGGFTRRPFFADPLPRRGGSIVQAHPAPLREIRAEPMYRYIAPASGTARTKRSVTSGEVVAVGLQDSMNALLASRSFRDRARPQCEPMRFRAVITIDFEAADVVEAQDAMTAIEAALAPMQPLPGAAQLSFTRRRPRSRPRPGAPGPVVPAYADD